MPLKSSGNTISSAPRSRAARAIPKAFSTLASRSSPIDIWTSPTVTCSFMSAPSCLDSSLSRRPCAARLLLGDAVNVAPREHDLAAGHGDDLALGEEALHPLARRFSGGVVKDGHHAPAVAGVEVEVGGGHAIAGPTRYRSLDRIHAP